MCRGTDLLGRADWSAGTGRRGAGGSVSQADDHDEWVDLGRPAGDAKLAKKYVKSRTASDSRSCRAVRRGHRRRRHGPGDDRQLVARPEAERSGRARLQQDRARRDLPDHQHDEPACRPLDQSAVQAIFGGDVRNWSGVPGSTVSGTIDVIVRTAASGTQDAFQKIFMGSKKIFARRRARRHRTGWWSRPSSATTSRSATSRWRSTTGRTRSAYKGVPCTLRNAKSGQYGGLRNFYMVTRGRARRSQPRSSSAGSAEQGRARDHGHSVGPAQLTAHRQPGRPGARSRARRTSAPSGCSARWSSTVLALIAGMVLFVFPKAWPSFSHNGLAWFGAAAATSTASSPTSSTRPPTIRLHAARVAADLGRPP